MEQDECLECASHLLRAACLMIILQQDADDDTKAFLGSEADRLRDLAAVISPPNEGGWGGSNVTPISAYKKRG